MNFWNLSNVYDKNGGEQRASHKIKLKNILGVHPPTKWMKMLHEILRQ
jgi:hypothetical protein